MTENPYKAPGSVPVERRPVPLWRKVACYALFVAATLPGTVAGVFVDMLLRERVRPGLKIILAFITLGFMALAGLMVWFGIRIRR